MTDQANDKQQAVPMAKAALENLEAAGIELPKSTDGSHAAIPNTADAGYFSEKAVGVLEAMGIDPYIAIGREKDNKSPVAADAERPPRRRMRRERRAPRRRCGPSCNRQLARRFTRRKHIVEPVFGQIKSGRGIRGFLLRGVEKVTGEWQLICLTHSLLKIWVKKSAGSACSGG